MRVYRDDQGQVLTRLDPSQKTGENIWYEFEGKDGKGNKIDVEVSSNGKRIVIELDDDTDARSTSTKRE